MARYTENLNLELPSEMEYFTINTWNYNMRILDEAYALLSGQTSKVTADLVSYDNSQSGLDAHNVQTALDKLASTSQIDNLYIMTVTEDVNLTVATYAHIYFVLSFGATVPEVTFSASIPEKDFVWEGGEPVFQPNSTYELSFLHLDCKWFKR